MDWLSNLFFGEGIAHSLLVLALVIAVGVFLGKIKVFGISFGITWILFLGILASHFGMRVESRLLEFAREFGLVLFVYSIGLQVGPSFFSSFKKTGLKMNAIAMCAVFASIAVALAISYARNVPIQTMVGILSGAVTNTPGLGAAQQTFSDIKGTGDPSIALGYAVAYPMGVVGLILSMIVIKAAFRISLERERKAVSGAEGTKSGASRISIRVKNPAVFGMRIEDIVALTGRHFVISRVSKPAGPGKILIASGETVLDADDTILVVAENRDADFVTAFLGERIEMEWQKLDTGLEARRIMITNPQVNGHTLGKLGLFGGVSFNITRVNRAGIDLVAHSDLALQMGDRVTIVGTSTAIENAEKLLGNSMMKLRQPNLFPIFLGIFLGVLAGSIPFSIPGIPQSVRLGLAGGPLVVAILLGRFGPRFKLVTYTTVSANLMVREIGIALFLAAVGLGAGSNFVKTIVEGDGLMWVLYGAAITVIPMLAVGACARIFAKTDYFTLMGIMAGSSTNPPALAYANATAANDRPAVAYATVYPLTMFMRVLTAQLLIILFAA